jgi:hypothetical protein
MWMNVEIFCFIVKKCSQLSFEKKNVVVRTREGTFVHEEGHTLLEPHADFTTSMLQYISFPHIRIILSWIANPFTQTIRV